MKWEEYGRKMEKTRNAYKILTGKPDGTRLPGRPRCRLEGNIKMDSDDVKWTELAQDSVREGVPVITVPSKQFP
jgi:hypothetical protein